MYNYIGKLHSLAQNNTRVQFVLFQPTPPPTAVGSAGPTPPAQPTAMAMTEDNKIAAQFAAQVAATLGSKQQASAPQVPPPQHTPSSTGAQAAQAHPNAIPQGHIRAQAPSFQPAAAPSEAEELPAATAASTEVAEEEPSQDVTDSKPSIEESSTVMAEVPEAQDSGSSKAEVVESSNSEPQTVEENIDTEAEKVAEIKAPSREPSREKSQEPEKQETPSTGTGIIEPEVKPIESVAAESVQPPPKVQSKDSTPEPAAKKDTSPVPSDSPAATPGAVDEPCNVVDSTPPQTQPVATPLQDRNSVERTVDRSSVDRSSVPPSDRSSVDRSSVDRVVEESRKSKSRESSPVIPTSTPAVSTPPPTLDSKPQEKENGFILDTKKEEESKYDCV